MVDSTEEKYIPVEAHGCDEPEDPAEDGDICMLGDSEAQKAKKPSKARKPMQCHDLKKMFQGGEQVSDGNSQECRSQPCPPASLPLPSPARAPTAQPGSVLLSACKLKVSSVQQVSDEGMAAPLAPMQKHIANEQSTDASVDLDPGSRMERLVLTAPICLKSPFDAVPLLQASVPLLESGKAIFNQLPTAWLDITGNNTALGTRCLFASRRHERSVFERIPPDMFLQVPAAAMEWQLPLDVPAEAVKAVEDDIWLLQIHPGKKSLRILLRPGILLVDMIRRGTALPAARFVWRVIDSSQSDGKDSRVEDRSASHSMGEFSILSNLEDPACTQPPNFLQHPLRREQLRSLGWMLSQERRGKDPFVTELRQAVPCPDAPHWKLEGSLRCEYRDVKGGVLADAIGYGKTACTIGLIDKTKEAPRPVVPAAFRGFIPSRATLVLAPTNLHKQWLAEIVKFTGDALKVISVPTCAQLKRLTVRELADADVIVATYRLFYSSPYLHRLEELARESSFGFAFPKKGQKPERAGQSGPGTEWSQAYRTAFEALPGWVAKLGIDGFSPEEKPAASSSGKSMQSQNKRSQECRGSRLSQTVHASQASPSQKRRRIVGKQADCTQASEAVEGPDIEDWPMPALQTQYVPLEVFWWKRVVCDEFHELLSRYPPAQVAVELFHADYKWGLSGTPPCQTLIQIRKAAGFLGVQLPEHPTDVDKEEPRKVAQEWLDAFVRRNTSELPPLEEDECIVPVKQTTKERALYLALTQQQQLSQELGLSASQSQELPQEIKALREVGQTTCGLLKLCSHFCFSGASDVLTAEDECQKQLALRRERILKAEREIKTQAERAALLAQLIRHFEPFFAKKPDAASCSSLSGESKAVLSGRLKFLGSKAQGSKVELLARLFEVAAAKGAAVRSRALAAGFDVKTAGKMSQFQETEEGGKAETEWKKLVDQLHADAGPHGAEGPVQHALRAADISLPSDPPARCVKLRKHLGMPAWAGADAEELAAQNWKWLNIRANAEKLQKVINAWKGDVLRSSLRLQELQVELADRIQSLTSFQETLHASQMEASGDLQEEGSNFAKYGSKIETLVKHAQKIQQDDPTAKMICFVQWEDLKRKISSALAEFSVPHIVLQGSVWGRQTALRKFQYEEGGPRMLLLSLEESASGTNLTAANHVLIVHPMEAHSQEEAVAFEMQAVGRVRRPGQQKKIHIWRFVTLDTIEQQITEEHQRELWERQAVKVQVSQPAREEDVESDVDVEDGEADAARAPDAGGCDEECTQRYVAAPQKAKGIEDDDEVVIDNRVSEMERDVAMMGGSEWEDCEATQCYAPP